MQIQPQITRANAALFKGEALVMDHPTADFFLMPKLLRDRPYWRIGFQLIVREQDPSTWTFKAKSARWGKACSAGGLPEIRQRIIDALHPARFVRLSPNLMLKPHCLCCGKGLTDPASIARWIGPECWGSASTNLPRLFNATEEAAA